MTFQPLIPQPGLAGWTFLERTRDRQQEAFDRSPQIRRDTDYFREKIGSIDTAEQLVSDRRLLRVALGAFGLDDDLDNRFFIRTVLEEGTLSPAALANRLSDKRYFAMAEAFSFDFGVPNSKLSDFPDRILSAYRDRQFEIAVGDQDSTMRLALGLERDLGDILSRENSETGYWYAVLGNTALRTVFETAFGLPSTLARIDVDQQAGILRDRARRVFGSESVTQFRDPAALEALTRRFLVQSSLTAAPPMTVAGSAALAILQASTA